MAEMNDITSGSVAAELKISPLSSQWHGKRKQRQAGYFRNNLEHLEMVERAMKLRLCAACLRIKGIDRLEKTPFARFAREFSDIKSVRKGIEALEARRKEMEKASIKKGIDLKLLRLAGTYGLDEFDQLVVQLLLVYQTSTEFKALVEACNDESWGTVFSMPATGTILCILCPDYRSQLSRLPHFSMEGTLLREDIMKAEGSARKRSVMEVKMSLDGQIVRFIMGDDRRYKSDFSCIEVARPAARLEQVIIDRALKKDVVEYAENFLRSCSTGAGNEDFFGYGTGLTMLFHGPSGTGKTMMAHALAGHLGKNLLSPRPDEVEELFDIAQTDILPRLFREARLSGGIVFLDECDDIIRTDSAASRAFLIEIEKARCITILATNKVTDLDPALERRISLKARFGLPGRDDRARIWQTLLPPDVQIADDVDFEELAERFVFTGGLIKNAVLMALNGAGKEGADLVLTRKALFKAASYQAQTMFETSRLEHSYKPGISIQKLPIRTAEKAFLARLPEAQRWSMETRGRGILCYLGCRDLETAVSCVDAVATECGTGVSLFKLSEILTPVSEEQKVLDRINQRETDILDYVLSSKTGRDSIIAVVDEQFELKNHLHDHGNASRWRVFLKRATRFPGLLFIVSEPSKEALPFEFTCNLAIQPPPEELQIEAWQKHLPGEREDAIICLVEQHPLHLGEIKEIASQAEIKAMLQGGPRNLGVRDILPILKRLRGMRQTPVLFGKPVLAGRH